MLTSNFSQLRRIPFQHNVCTVVRITVCTCTILLYKYTFRWCSKPSKAPVKHTHVLSKINEFHQPIWNHHWTHVWIYCHSISYKPILTFLGIIHYERTTADWRILLMSSSPGITTSCACSRHNASNHTVCIERRPKRSWNTLWFWFRKTFPAYDRKEHAR